MTDELCARKGCGFPKAWHSRESTIEDLYDWDNGGVLPSISLYRAGTACLAVDSICAAYLAPDPPKPERKAHVVMMTDEEAQFLCRVGEEGTRLMLHTPLDEYLAAHPQPTPALCICSGKEMHHSGGRCNHFVKWVGADGLERWGSCYCTQYRAVSS